MITNKCIIMKLLRLLIILTLLGISANGVKRKTAYAMWEGNDMYIKSKLSKTSNNPVAKGTFLNSINATGWSYLTIETIKDFPDERQAYAAGFLEGHLTHDLIYMHWYNTIKDFCTGREDVCDKVNEYLAANRKWVNKMLSQYNTTFSYWHQVRLFYKQLAGLADGYKEANKGNNATSLTYNDILWLNLQGDLEDLVDVFSTQRNPESYVPFSVRGSRVPGAASCSALIKLLPDASDLYVAHDTWSSLQSMLRVQKKYVFPFRMLEDFGKIVPGKAMTFSSYPGELESGDDFYVISTGLVTMETTIGNNNKSLWQYIQPQGQVYETLRIIQLRLAPNIDANTPSSFQLLSPSSGAHHQAVITPARTSIIWQPMWWRNSIPTPSERDRISPVFVAEIRKVLEMVRAMVANRLADSGSSWTKIFGMYNSGTYNNQWMVVDYKRFKPRIPLKNDLLWVLEQIPGHIKAADVTHILQDQSYWPSYNSPYFKSIFKLSGNEELVIKYGDWFSYERTPRALMFRRDHDKVVDTDSMIALMRYINYKHDPLSRCNCTPPYSAENTIACRSDLNPENGTYPFSALGHRSHAATDMKLTTAKLASKLMFIAISGPPYNKDVPVFRWDTSDYGSNTPHLGHPNIWDFGPVLHKWK